MQIEYGTRRMSFTMQPCGRNGQPINYGNHYANAHTLEDAHDYARRVLASGEVMGYTVRSVSIDGALYEFTGHAWVSLHSDYHHEVIHSELPYPYTADDLKKQCYDTTVMDYFETVHERRSDGTCRCGDPTRNARQ
jgi:hypothetical protein